MRTLILLFLLFSFGCQDSKPLFSKIKSCCETSPILATVGNGKIYVPNIFTPNNDGINDRLTIFASEEITLIKKVEIKDGSKVIFSATNFEPFDSNNEWDGRKDDEIVKGVFSVEIEITDIDGNTQILTGEVCCLPCGNNSEKEKKFDNIDNCFFGAQHDGEGGVDSNLPSFEELVCLE